MFHNKLVYSNIKTNYMKFELLQANVLYCTFTR